MTEKKRVEDFTEAVYNPRAISDDALEGLRKSIAIFGDLSGLVLNDNTANIICGHQRRKILVGLDLTDIVWAKTYKAELGYEGERFTSAEQDGVITTNDGARFHVRKVLWPIEFEQAANIAANDERLQAEWDPAMLNDVVKNLELIAPVAVETFDLSSLKIDMGPEDEVNDESPVMQERSVKPLPKMAWVLIGIPLGQYAKLSDFVNKCSSDKDILCEATYNDDDNQGQE